MEQGSEGSPSYVMVSERKKVKFPKRAERGRWALLLDGHLAEDRLGIMIMQ